MVIFRSNFSVFLSFNTQLTHLNASNLLNFDPSNRFLPIASQSWCSGVSNMATYIYIVPLYICSKIAGIYFHTFICYAKCPQRASKLQTWHVPSAPLTVSTLLGIINMIGKNGGFWIILPYFFPDHIFPGRNS